MLKKIINPWHKLLSYLTKVEQFIVHAVTTTLLLLEELGELVDVTDTVFPRAHTYLSGVIAVNETLLSELDEVYAVICSKSLVIARYECTSSANVKCTFLEEIVVVVLPYQNNYLH